MNIELTESQYRTARAAIFLLSEAGEPSEAVWLPEDDRAALKDILTQLDEHDALPEVPA